MSQLSVPFNNPTPETAHRAKCELAEEVLRSFGGVRLRVRGLSMLPSVWPGDVLLIRRQDIGETSPGDIVLFTRGGGLVAHRVVLRKGDRERTLVITRGDALSALDSPITAADLLGKVCRIRRAGQWFEPRTRLSFSGRLMAALISRSARVGMAFEHLHAMRRHSDNKQQEVACEG
jgi:signal peptidase I